MSEMKARSKIGSSKVDSLTKQRERVNHIDNEKTDKPGIPRK